LPVAEQKSMTKRSASKWRSSCRIAPITIILAVASGSVRTEAFTIASRCALPWRSARNTAVQPYLEEASRWQACQLAIPTSTCAVFAVATLRGAARKEQRRRGVRGALPGKSKSEYSYPPPPREGDYIDRFCRATNAAFEQLVLPPIREKVQVQPAGTAGSDILDKLTAAPEVPGISRPLWLVMTGSIPTILGWYGYYKFSVEEELFQYELRKEGRATGCGGYGTLFPFVFAVLFGLAARAAGLLQLGDILIAMGSVWILLGQVNLYRRVNEVVQEDPCVSDGKPVLWEWWALLPPPIDVIVGVRQVHFLARASAAARGEAWEKDVVAEELFPFISAPRFSLKEFFLTPSMWFWFTKDADNLDLQQVVDKSSKKF